MDLLKVKRVILPIGLLALSLMTAIAVEARADWGDIFSKSRTERVGTADGRIQARLYIPKVTSTHARPLIVLLHGYGFDPERNLRYLNLRDVSAEREVLLLVPEGTRTKAGAVFWNATEFCCDTDGAQPNDVAYLLKLVADVKASHNVDSNRIYLVGYSNGAFMANRLVCETSGIFSAVVSIAGGTFKNEASCQSKDPVSFLQIHADDDATITFDSDPRYAGGREAYERYFKQNKCGLEDTSVGKRDLVLNVPGAETITTSSFCIRKTETSLWLIQANGRKAGHKPSLTTTFAPSVLDWALRQRLHQETPTY